MKVNDAISNALLPHHSLDYEPFRLTLSCQRHSGSAREGEREEGEDNELSSQARPQNCNIAENEEGFRLHPLFLERMLRNGI